MSNLNIYRGNNKFAYCKVSLRAEFDGQKHISVEMNESPNISISGQLGGINIGSYTCALIPKQGYAWDIEKNGWANIEKDDITLNEGFNELYLKELTDGSTDRFAVYVTLEIVPQQIVVDIDYKEHITYDNKDHSLIKSATPSHGRMLYSEDDDCFSYDINGIKSDAQYYKDLYIKDKISDLTIYEIYGYKLNNVFYKPNGAVYSGDVSLLVPNNIITLTHPLQSDVNKIYYGKLVDYIDNKEYDNDGNKNYFIPWEDMQKYVDITFGNIHGTRTDTYIFIHTFNTPLLKDKYYYFDFDINKACIYCTHPLRANYPVKTINKYWDNNLTTSTKTHNGENLQLEYDGVIYPYFQFAWNADNKSYPVDNKLVYCSQDVKNIWYHLSGDNWEDFNEQLKNNAFSHNVWSTEIPVKRDVNNYKLYYRTTTIVESSQIIEELTEDTNYLNAFGSVNVSIDSYKLSIDDITKLPEELIITYNSMEHDLINQGVSNEYTLYYKLSNDDEWTTSVPKASVVGDYTVQFYIKSNNENILDSDIYELHSQVVKHVIKADGVYVFPDYQNINKFIIENNILPSGFKLLNHLDCDGSFFFDLGWELFEGINIDLNVRPIKPNEGLGKKTTYWRGIFGVYTDDGDNDTGFGLYTTNYTKSPWYIAMNMFGYTNPKMYNIMSYHSYNIRTNLKNIYINDETCNNDLCHVNDRYYTLDIDTINPNNKSVYLLSVNSEVPVNPFIGKFYSLNIYNTNGDTVHKYVPCTSNVKYYTVKEHTTVDNITIGSYYISMEEYNNLTIKEKHALTDYIDRTPVYLDGIFDLITRKFIGKTSINKYNQSIENNDKYLTFDNLSYIINENGTLKFDVFNYNQEPLTFVYGLYDMINNKYYGLSIEKFDAMTGYSKSIDVNSYLPMGTYNIVPVCQLLGSETWNSTLSITLGNSYNLYYKVIKRSPTSDNINKFIITIESKSKDYNFNVDSYDSSYDSSFDSCSHDHTIESPDLDI